MADLMIDIPRRRDQIETESDAGVRRAACRGRPSRPRCRHPRGRARTARRVTPDPIDSPGTPDAAGPALTAGGAVFARLAGSGSTSSSSTRGPTSRRSSKVWPRREAGDARRAAHDRRPPRARGDEHGARLLLRDRPGPGGHAPHERRVGQRRHRRDQRRHRPRADASLMSGRTPTIERGRFGARTVPIGWGQEMRDQAALVREACKWDYELRFPEQVPELLDRALRDRHHRRRRVPSISACRARCCASRARPTSSTAPIAMRGLARRAAAELLAAVAALLAGAERPLIIAQRGAGLTRPASPRSPGIAEQWSIPVCQWWAVATAISSRAPDVRRPGPEPLDRGGRRDPRHRQPRAMDARRSTDLPYGLSGDPPRPEPALQPVPGAQLPVRPLDHHRGRRPASWASNAALRELGPDAGPTRAPAPPRVAPTTRRRAASAARGRAGGRPAASR